MYVKKSKKLLLASLLALIAVFAMFGAAWAAPGLTITRNTAVPGNIGPITTGAANVYYVNTAASVTVGIDMALDSAGDTQVTVTLQPADAPTGTVLATTPPSGVIANGGSATGTITIPTSSLTAGTPVTITLTALDNSSVQATGNVLTITPIAVQTTSTIPATAEFFVGLANSTGYSLTPIALTATTPTVCEYANLTVWRGATQVTSDLWGSSNVLLATTPAAIPTFKLTAATAPTAAQSETSFTISGDVKITTPVDGVVKVAGLGTTNLGSFKAKITQIALGATKPVSLDLTVGVAAVTSTDYVDISVTPSAVALSGLTISSGDAGSTLATGRWAWNNLTLSPDLATKKIVITGTPQNAGTLICTVSATSASGDVKPVSFDLTVASAADYTMILSPDVTAFSGKVSEALSGDLTVAKLRPSGTTGSGDITVTSTTFATLVVSADSTTTGATAQTGGSLTWNGLVISPDITAGKATISGTPITAGNGSFKLTGTSLLGTIAAKSFTISITNPHTTLTVTPSPYTVIVGTYVSDDLTVGPTTLPSLVSMDIDGGGATATWNNLTITANHVTKKIYIDGTPLYAMPDEIFTLKARDAAGTLYTGSFVISTQSQSGSIINVTPTMYDDNGVRVTTMKVNELMMLIFGTTVNLSGSNIGVYVIAPDGTPAVALPKLSTWTSGNGFVVNPSDITVYYTPTMNGDYKFVFYYTYGGASYTQTITVRAGGSHKSGGSGGCDAGLGLTALLALGGLALLRRRED